MIIGKVDLGVLLVSLITLTKSEKDWVGQQFTISQYIDMLEVKTADCDFCGMTFFGAVSFKVCCMLKKIMHEKQFNNI